MRLPMTNPIRRRCCRSLLVLVVGAAGYITLHDVVPPELGGVAAMVVVLLAYWPLARLRCPHCHQVPFRHWLNVGPLPLLCFASSQKCHACRHDILGK